MRNDPLNSLPFMHVTVPVTTTCVLLPANMAEELIAKAVSTLAGAWLCVASTPRPTAPCDFAHLTQEINLQ